MFCKPHELVYFEVQIYIHVILLFEQKDLIKQVAKLQEDVPASFSFISRGNKTSMI